MQKPFELGVISMVEKSNYSPHCLSRGDHDSKRWKTGRFRQRVSDETIGCID